MACITIAYVLFALTVPQWRQQNIELLWPHPQADMSFGQRLPSHVLMVLATQSYRQQLNPYFQTLLSTPHKSLEARNIGIETLGLRTKSPLLHTKGRHDKHTNATLSTKFLIDGSRAALQGFVGLRKYCLTETADFTFIDGTAAHNMMFL